MTVAEDTLGERGLTSSEVADRHARGMVNDLPDSPTRSIRQIIRANVLTPFNFLLGSLLIVILAVGPLNDALFGGVIIANTLIGVIQEARAKRTLDRLSVLSAPKANVRRDGTSTEIAINQIVLDDLVELSPGDQLPVDGQIVRSSALEIDESLLTGESDAVDKQPGDTVLSGSFVAAGSGTFRATRVGRDAYASQVAEEARRFTLARSELRSGIDFIVRIVGIAMIPTGVLLLFNQIRLHLGVADAVGGTVAALVAMIPEGLILLTSVAFAVSVVRLGKRNVVVQELPAVETLARVDVICLDKTGTLTEGALTLDRIVAGPSVTDAEARRLLAMMAASEAVPNSTLRALGIGLEVDFDAGVPEGITHQVPFSSARKWSAATFADGTNCLLGAPDVLMRAMGELGSLSEAIEVYASQGKRVLLLAAADAPVSGDQLPSGLRPLCLALMEDRVRDDAGEALSYFADQGVIVKVISGDHPATVTAVARRTGLVFDDGVDAATLPDDPELLADVMEEHAVFGRVSPQQKRAMVAALQSRGHVVAMTGDGVNDVLALKDADIGIAMGSGAPATRSAAQLVLLDGKFSALPPVVAEGRRVIGNIERVSNLFLTKTVYAMLLALAVGVAGLPFPFLPRHLTLVGALTIGIPAFFLALAPNEKRAEPHFVARVMRFAAPAGFLCAAATFAGYYVAHLDTTLSLDQQRTTAALVLVSLGLLILVQLASPMTGWRQILVGSMVAIIILALALPAGRAFFALTFPPVQTLLAAVGVVALAWWVMVIASRLTALYHRPYERLMAAQDRREEKVAAISERRAEGRTTPITIEAPVVPDRVPSTLVLPPSMAPTQTPPRTEAPPQTEVVTQGDHESIAGPDSPPATPRIDDAGSPT